MATLPLYQPEPLEALLAALPGLPRPVLSHLAARIIERLDEIDGDPDLEEADEPILSGKLGDHPWLDEDAEEGGDADDPICFHDPNDQRRMLSRWGWQDADQ